MGTKFCRPFAATILLITACLGTPGLAWAQADDKDAIIEKQRQEIALLKAQLEVQKRDAMVIEDQLKAIIKRLRDEIEVLAKTLKDREKAMIQLEADKKTLGIEAVTLEAQVKALQFRNEKLLEALRDEVARAAKGDKPIVEGRNPNEPNPPSVLVNGKIEKVANGIVQISLGLDHGVGKNHTLDVYRLKPEPKYLGMIRIVEANQHTSIGRLVPLGNAVRPTLQVDDLVTSRLTGESAPREKESPK